MPYRCLYGLIYSDERQQAIFIAIIFCPPAKSRGRENYAKCYTTAATTSYSVFIVSRKETAFPPLQYYYYYIMFTRYLFHDNNFVGSAALTEVCAVLSVFLVIIIILFISHQHHHLNKFILTCNIAVIVIVNDSENGY